MHRDGNYTFYYIQFRTTHESEWGKPDGPLKPVERKNPRDHEWAGTGSDYWGHSLNPHIGRGNNWRARNKKASDEMREIDMATGHCGWYTLKYALAALRRLRKDDEAGHYDSTDNYRHKMAAVRHEFRLVKVTMSRKTEVLADEKNPLLAELV